MPDRPARPDLDKLRHQANDLLHAAQRGDSEATARISAVSDRVLLSSAQLAIAREYGFPSWAKLKLEVERRDILNRRDLLLLTSLLAEHPELATDRRPPARGSGLIRASRAQWPRAGCCTQVPGTVLNIGSSFRRRIWP